MQMHRTLVQVHGTFVQVYGTFVQVQVIFFACPLLCPMMRLKICALCEVVPGTTIFSFFDAPLVTTLIRIIRTTLSGFV
jgi:hypothetical protein